MSRRLPKHTLPAGAMAIALLVIGAPAAYAGPGTCTNTFVISGPSLNQNFTIDAGGTTVTPIGGSGTFNCIEQQDKLFSAFNFGNLPAGATANFNFTTIGGQDVHSISLAGSGLTNGSSYTVGYNIEVLASNTFLSSAAAGILQTLGVSSLIETLVNNLGVTNTIQFTQTNATPNSGSVTTTPLSPTSIWEDVTDTLTLSANGSDATGESNSFIEVTPVPEPAALLLLGTGLIGLGLIDRRRKAATPA